MMEIRWTRTAAEIGLAGQNSGRAPVILAAEADFRIGRLTVRPAQRRIAYCDNSQTLEPRWMQVLVILGREAQRLVTRDELFDRCWGAIVGDDSLNRAIAGLRRAGRCFGAQGFTIKTVKAAGYVLMPATTVGARSDALDLAWTCWKRDAPVVDETAVAAVEAALVSDPDDPELHAMLALVLRMGAEHAEPAQRARLVERCESAAARALALDPGNPVAETALISLPPVFGDWIQRRARLLAVLAREPESAPALHEMAILEMATGRPSAAIPLVEQLLERFPNAPALLYKRIYHLWTIGDLDQMDRVGQRAVQLWPTHMAVAMARFWSLALSGRIDQAGHHLEEMVRVADAPAGSLAPFRRLLDVLHLRDSRGPEWRAVVDAILGLGRMGPVQANAALIQLAALRALDEAFALAEGYYFQRGPLLVGLQRVEGEAAVTDQSRRLTQPLFIPVSVGLRADPRFEILMEEMGLTAYWREAGIEPDYQRQSTARKAG